MALLIGLGNWYAASQTSGSGSGSDDPDIYPDPLDPPSPIEPTEGSDSSDSSEAASTYSLSVSRGGIYGAGAAKPYVIVDGVTTSAASYNNTLNTELTCRSNVVAGLEYSLPGTFDYMYNSASVTGADGTQYAYTVTKNTSDRVEITFSVGYNETNVQVSINVYGADPGPSWEPEPDLEPDM